MPERTLDQAWLSCQAGGLASPRPYGRTATEEFPTVEILRSPREIALMRKAGLLVWEAHQVGKALVRPGVTTAEIDAAVEAFFCRARGRAALQGRARSGPLSGGHVHFDQ